MTVYAEHLSAEAQQFNWLLNQFAGNTPEVIDAIAVSSDGLLIAMSHKLDRANADRLAATMPWSKARHTAVVRPAGVVTTSAS